MDAAGISVERSYMVECTACGGVVGEASTRGRAEMDARAHAEAHKKDGERTRFFRRYSDALEWAGY